MKYIIENTKSNYKDEIESIISNKLNTILEFFNSKEITLDTNIYIYNTIESLKENLIKRGFNKDPDYMCACFKDEDNSLNFFEPKDNPSNIEWSKEEYKTVIYHELIHAVIYKLYGYIPEWINEGIAKYLDGSYEEDYAVKLSNCLELDNIPNQIEIINEFGLHDYDSYDYVFLMVSYIIKEKGKEYLIDMLKNNKVGDIPDDLLITSIKYFKG